jgi:hypothetical protein
MSYTRFSLSFLLALAALAPPLRAQDMPVTFHVTAVNMSNVGRQGMFGLEVTIERWNTDDEFARLKSALVEKGSDALLSELQKIKPRAGSIRRSTGGLGWDIRYARRTDLAGGGHRVIFATDRQMSFGERASHPPSAEYEFLLGEIHVGADGKGEGKLVPMAKIAYDEDSRTLQIENYASEPVRFTQVREEKRKAK